MLRISSPYVLAPLILWFSVGISSVSYHRDGTLTADDREQSKGPEQNSLQAPKQEQYMGS